MTTRLSDLVIPELFQQILLKESTYLSAFFQTGAMATNDLLGSFAQNNYGGILNLPFLNDLDDQESDQSSDDPAEVASPGKITESNQTAVKNMRSRGWSSVDLAAALNGRDPMNAIASRTAAYWSRQIDTSAVSMLEGILADNIASDGGDMVYDASGDLSTPTAEQLISAENVINAKATAGDHSEGFNTIVMHSSPYHRLQALNLIDFIPDSRGEINIPTYLGMRVVVSDQVGVAPQTNSPRYTTTLLRDGAIMFAEGAPKTPVEVWRNPQAGNGEGLDELWTRRHWMAHVDGISNTAGLTATGKSPTNATLASAGSWDRTVADRKQIPLAFLLTN